MIKLTNIFRLSKKLRETEQKLSVLFENQEQIDKKSQIFDNQQNLKGQEQFEEEFLHKREREKLEKINNLLSQQNFNDFSQQFKQDINEPNYRDDLQFYFVDNFNRYLKFLSFISQSKLLQNMISEQKIFHKKIIQKNLNKININEKCQLYSLIKPIDMSLKLQIDIKDNIKKDYDLQNIDLTLKSNQLTISLIDSDILLKNLDQFEFTDSYKDSQIIFNIRKKLDYQQVHMLLKKFLQIDIDSYFKNMDDFLINGDVFLLLLQKLQYFDKKQDPEISQKVNEFIKVYVDKICACFDLGSVVNLVKCFKLIKSMDFIIEQDQNNIIWNKIMQLDIQKICEPQDHKSGLQHFIFLVNYYIISQLYKQNLKNIDQIKIQDMILQNEKQYNKDRLYQKVLPTYLLNGYYKVTHDKYWKNLQNNKNDKIDIDFENKMIFIFEEHFKKSLGRNQYSFAFLIKIFKVLRFLYVQNEIQNKHEEQKIILKNMLRLQFNFAFHLKAWNYNEKMVGTLKEIVTFYNSKKVGSRKVKQLFFCAIDNTDKQERNNIYQEYLKEKQKILDDKKNMKQQKTHETHKNEKEPNSKK